MWARHDSNGAGKLPQVELPVGVQIGDLYVYLQPYLV